MRVDLTDTIVKVKGYDKEFTFRTSIPLPKFEYGCRVRTEILNLNMLRFDGDWYQERAQLEFGFACVESVTRRVDKDGRIIERWEFGT